MNDQSALLASILANPADDAPRLIYADWLDEHGECERGEFIRVQIAIANYPPCDWVSGKSCDPAGLPACEMFNAKNQLHTFCKTCMAMNRLREREKELWNSNPGFGNRIPVPCYAALENWRRGFIESVTCQANFWLSHGPAIVASHPVERIEISDRTPRTDQFGVIGNGYWWSEGEDHHGFADNGNWIIEPAIYTLIAGFRRKDYTNKYFPTEAAARSALSDACIKWAKSAKPTMFDEVYEVSEVSEVSPDEWQRIPMSDYGRFTTQWERGDSLKAKCCRSSLSNPQLETATPSPAPCTGCHRR